MEDVKSVLFQNVSVELAGKEVQAMYFHKGHLFVRTGEETVRIVPLESMERDFLISNPEYVRHELDGLPGGEELMESLDRSISKIEE